jgi:UTP:GlnB (protein PII) uridylyltransferase
VHLQSLVAQNGRHRYLGKTFNRTVGVTTVADHTAIELTGTDRPGLLAEISEALHKLGCNVKHAEVWTHNLRVACVVYVTDENTGGTVEDAEKQAQIREKLAVVMNGGRDEKRSKTEFGNLRTNRERRLHQMMFEDRDFEKECGGEDFEKEKDGDDEARPTIDIGFCKEKGYSIVNVKCVDRPKLLFDTVCTLTDMQFVVFHATINSADGLAYQEYYIRHTDGRLLDSDDEKLRVKKCLLAAIERRVSDVSVRFYHVSSSEWAIFGNLKCCSGLLSQLSAVVRFSTVFLLI